MCLDPVTAIACGVMFSVYGAQGGGAIAPADLAADIPAETVVIEEPQAVADQPVIEAPAEDIAVQATEEPVDLTEAQASEVPAAGAPATVDASDPQRIADLLGQMGYRASLAVDNLGDPMIESKASGKEFVIYFYGCENNANCRAIQFASGFDLESGTTHEVINDWNANNRFTRAYLDDEMDPFLELDVNLDLGGVAEENLRDTMDWWDVKLGEFIGHIGW
jgi:Rieske Fe-S protein